MTRRSALAALRNEIAWRDAHEVREAHARYAPPAVVHHGQALTHIGEAGTVHAWSCTCGARGRGFATAAEMLASLNAHLPSGTECEYSTVDTTRRAK